MHRKSYREFVEKLEKASAFSFRTVESTTEGHTPRYSSIT